MAPTLYMFHGSPPVRAVLITAKAIGLDLNIKELDMFKGDLKTPEYHKLNPQHTVPTLVDDDGFTIWDSHAIMAYLVEKYAKNDSLYPSDLKARAVVNQRLFFETGVVFIALGNIMRSIIFGGKTSVDEPLKEAVLQVFSFLNSFLEGKKWAAGDKITIADYSLISSISSLNSFIPIDAKLYPNVSAWLKRAEQLPEYEANVKGLKDFSDFVNSKLSQ